MIQPSRSSLSQKPCAQPSYIHHLVSLKQKILCQSYTGMFLLFKVVLLLLVHLINLLSLLTFFGLLLNYILCETKNPNSPGPKKGSYPASTLFNTENTSFQQTHYIVMPLQTYSHTQYKTLVKGNITKC